ncbi:MAG: polysaccharide biosynthesis/export family protein [Verrucomicrobiota bacterium]
MKRVIGLIIVVAVLLGFLGSVEAQEQPLRSGDQMTFDIKGVPDSDRVELQGAYTVGDDGNIHLPYIAPQRALGVTPTNLARKIEMAYRSAEIYSRPSVTIQVAVVGPGNTQLVSVMGEVKAPNAVPFAPGMTVFDAITKCSGFSDFADPSRIKLFRGANETIHDLRQVTPENDVKLSPGDKIIVSPKPVIPKVFKIFGGGKDKDNR